MPQGVSDNNNSESDTVDTLATAKHPDEALSQESSDREKKVCKAGDPFTRKG